MDEEGAICAWHLDDADEPIGTGLSLSTDALPIGLHSVRLVVTPLGVGTEPIIYEQQNCVLVYPKTMYVDAENATPESPYDSPLIGNGLNQPWMTGATDFVGKARVSGRRVDIGAFEGNARGLMLIVR